MGARVDVIIREPEWMIAGSYVHAWMFSIPARDEDIQFNVQLYLSRLLNILNLGDFSNG